jgi:general secretion pathway protein D
VPAPTAGSVALSWQAPAQIKLGEQFSAALRVTSQTGLRGLPALLAFDPQALQVVGVQEGTFFKQAGGNTNFSQRIDAAQGKVFVTVVRQNAAGSDAGVNGAGTLATVTFKAIKAGDARLQLLSASPEPAAAAPLALPVEQSVRVVP